VTGRLIDTVTANAHEFIIAKQLGFTQLGLFSRAMGLVEMFASNVTTAIARVAMPAMASAHRDEQNLTGSFARGTAIFTSIAWPFFGFVAIAAPEILRVLFGPQWDAAGPVASLLAVSMLPSALFALSASTLAAMGQVRRRLQISLQFGPIHLVGLLLASLVGGVQTIALAWMATRTMLLWLHSRQLCMAMNARFRDLYWQSMANVLLAATTVFFQFCTMALCRRNAFPALTTLVLAAAVGVATWYVHVRLMRLPVHDELLRMRASVGGGA
jgi:O-antigen/teichoic acid export membrane protein